MMMNWREVMPVSDMSKFREYVDRFEDAVVAFENDEMSIGDFKSISGYFGCIPQRDGRMVVRFRFTGGKITSEDIRFILRNAKEHKAELIHLTTGQTVQLHGLGGKQAADTIRSAVDAGIVTKGAGGNNPRNVSSSPLSGLDSRESFDVLPFAEATDAYLLGIADSIDLPYKFKVSFSNGTECGVHATVKDLGFVAQKDGTFDVYSGGGMGNKGGRIGVKVLGEVPPEKVLYCVEAAVSLYLEYGEGISRAESRFRFLRDRLSEDGFLSEFKTRFERSLNRGGLDLDIDPSLRINHENVDAKGIIPQKNGILFAVHVPFIGDPCIEDLSKFLKILEDNHGSEIRLSPDQTLYFINMEKGPAKRLASEYAREAETEFRSSVSCVGYPICRTGRRNSRDILDSLLQMEMSSGLPDGALPKIGISGCGSSCACHPLYLIGLKGTTVRLPEGNLPGFEIHLGGSSVCGQEKLGDVIGSVPESRLLDFFRSVGEEASKEGFRIWVASNRKRFVELVEEFSSK